MPEHHANRRPPNGAAPGLPDAAALIRAFDWSRTPLGPRSEWPTELRTLVSVMLGSNQPMFVVWGPERTLIYNDDYIPILAAKHPSAMGRDFLEVWRELQADLGPIVAQAYRGEPVQMDDIPLVMERRGFPEETHFSFFYSPVRDAAGEVRGFFCACTEITAQVMAERRAAAERERQRLMLQRLPGFVALLSGPEHRLDYVNDAFRELVGDRPLLGLPVRAAFPEIEGQGFFERLDRVFATGEAFAARAARVSLRRGAGRGAEEERFVDLVYQVLRDDAGTPSGIFVSGFDVTEAVRAGQLLRAREARLRSVLNGMREGFALFDPGFRILELNEEALRLHGRGREELVGRCLWETLSGGEGSEIADAYRRAMELGEPASLECWDTGPDGAARCLDIRAYPVPEGLAVFFRDITDRKQMERRASEAAERVELALDSGAVVGTWVWDVPEDRFTADERFARAFDLDPDRCRAGMAIEEVVASIHPDDVAGVREALAEVLARGGPYRREYRVRQPGGAYRWIEAVGRVEPGPDGSPRRFPGVLLDAQERRLAAEERDRAAALLRSVAEAVPGVVYAKDRAGRMLVANRGMAELVGKPPAEFLGKTAAEFLADPAEAEAIMASDRRVMESGEAEQTEEEVRLAGGARAVLLTSRAPMRDARGAVVGLIGSAVDITARKQAEAVLARGKEELERLVEERTRELAETQARLAHAQRMEALGQLAGGIAHDFNNVLQAVQGASALLERRPGDPAGVRRLARMVAEAADRGSAITRRLLAFSRRGDLRAEAVEPLPLLLGLREVLVHTLGAGVGVRVQGASTLPPLLADKGQLETVLVNLAANARDAMDGQGALTLSAGLEAAGPGHRAGLPPGRYIRLTVDDTGAGMSPEVLARAAEPFFTTKPPGQGTGLGLAMARGFAEQSGGALDIASEAGKGTSVSLWLPVAPEASLAAAKPERAEEPARPSRRVLLADDDALVREVMAEGLESGGCTVLTASSGPEALALLDAGEVVDLLVSDLSMPGMDGVALIREAQRRRAGLPAILLTGFATGAAELAIGGALSGTFSLLRKPATPEQIAERVAVMLEGAELGGG